MADNLTLNAGTGGATAAADDIGGVHHQRVKIEVGSDGAAQDCLPVTNGMDSTGTGVQAVGITGQLDDTATGTVTENQFAPVRISSRRALLVEGVASGTAVGVSAASLPLPTGAASAANQSTIIGHLDGVEGLLTTIDADTSNLSVVGGGTEAAAIRVTIASDSTGVLSIDDNGGAITVDGTVAVTNAGLTELAAAIDTELQVDVVGSLPAGDNNIGNVDLASAIPAGTNNIGDVDVASIAAGDNNIGNVDIASMPQSLDYDTGAGTATTPIVGIALPASGGPVAGGTVTNPVAIKITDGTDTADVLDLTNSNPLVVALVDTNGDQISSFGGGTQYTEDAAAAANPVGTAVILVRDDTPGALTSADGDNVAQRGTDFGAAYVTILDDSGNIVAGSTQYTEDAAAAGDPVGNATILVRADTPAAVTSANGDNVAQRGTDYGAAYVQVVDSSGNFVDTFGGSGGTAAADDADFTATTTQGTPAMGVYESTPTNVTDGDLGIVGITQDRQLKVSVGNTLTVASHAVTNAGTFAVQESGGALTALQLIDDAIFAEDVAAQAADKGISVLAVRRDTASTMVGADNDYTNLIVDGSGRLHVNVGNTVTVTATNLDVQSGGADLATSTQAGAIQTAVELIDNIVRAEDDASGNGHSGAVVLGVRTDTPNAARTGANGDYDFVSTYRTGAVRVALCEEDFAALGSNHVKKYYTNAGAVTDGIVWSPAAGARWYVTDIFINVSAAATVTLEDDKAGGDEVVWKAELAANSGWSHSFKTPLFSGEDAADLLVTTTAGNVYILIIGYEI